MLYLIFIIEKGLKFVVNSNDAKFDFTIGKSFNLLINWLLNFSFLGLEGNLITTNFVSSNNDFGIKNSSFSSLNLKKVSLMILTG